MPTFRLRGYLVDCLLRLWHKQRLRDGRRATYHGQPGVVSCACFPEKQSDSWSQVPATLNGCGTYCIFEAVMSCRVQFCWDRSREIQAFCNPMPDCDSSLWQVLLILLSSPRPNLRAERWCTPMRLSKHVSFSFFASWPSHPSVRHCETLYFEAPVDTWARKSLWRLVRQVPTWCFSTRVRS